MKKAGAIAGELGVHPDTIRNWTERFPEFFSPEARGEKGLRRVFTFEDADILYSIKTWLGQGFQFETIRAKLADGERLQTIPSPSKPLEGESALTVYSQLRQLETIINERDSLIEHLRQENIEQREHYKQQIDDLLQKQNQLLTMLNSDHVQNLNDLNRQLSELNREIGRYQAQIDFLKDQLNRNSSPDSD
jgi:DNA-binding transcriptional MerR regulator